MGAKRGCCEGEHVDESIVMLMVEEGEEETLVSHICDNNRSYSLVENWCEWGGHRICSWLRKEFYMIAQQRITSSFLSK
jgi:hypothetical protein